MYHKGENFVWIYLLYSQLDLCLKFWDPRKIYKEIEVTTANIFCAQSDVAALAALGLTVALEQKSCTGLVMREIWLFPCLSSSTAISIKHSTKNYYAAGSLDFHHNVNSKFLATQSLTAKPYNSPYTTISHLGYLHPTSSFEVLTCILIPPSTYLSVTDTDLTGKRFQLVT